LDEELVHLLPFGRVRDKSLKFLTENGIILGRLSKNVRKGSLTSLVRRALLESIQSLLPVRVSVVAKASPNRVVEGLGACNRSVTGPPSNRSAGFSKVRREQSDGCGGDALHGLASS
jgi:hypothetical protein